MSLKITTLIENMPDKEKKLRFEHGFSIWLELDNRKYLFDTGQTGEFVRNAELLGIDLSEADGVILSHGHYDHTGGVPAFLSEIRKKIPFYIGKEFFAPKYKRMEDAGFKYNGNPFPQELLTEDRQAELHYIEETVTKISEKLILFKNFSSRNNFEKVNTKFYVKTERGYEQDLFPDELALGVVTNKGMVLIVGCSHVGIVNILETVKETINLPVIAVVGGTHLVEADEERLMKTAEALKKFRIETIAVSHCTGEAGMELLGKEFPAEFVLNTTGNVMEF